MRTDHATSKTRHYATLPSTQSGRTDGRKTNVRNAGIVGAVTHHYLIPGKAPVGLANQEPSKTSALTQTLSRALNMTVPTVIAGQYR